MTAQPFQPTLDATTDAVGNCTWTLAPPTGSGLGLSLTISILGATGGSFVAFVNNGVRWGAWSGPQPFGPITYQGNQPLIIQATGLLPLTTYECQIQGIADDWENLDPTLPTATGTTSLFDTSPLVDVMGITMPNNTTITYPGFPCASFAALRLALSVTGGGPLAVRCNWLDAPRDFVMSERFFTVGGPAIAPFGAGQFLQGCFPHLGDSLDIELTNTSTAPLAFQLAATHSTQPLAAWGGQDFIPAPANAVGSLASIAAVSSQFIFGGPAQLEWSAGTLTNYLLQLQYMEVNRVWHTFWARDNTNPARASYPFIAPAAPLQLVVTNREAANRAFEYAVLEYDLSRVG